MPLSGPAVCRATRTDLLIFNDRPAVEQVIKYAGGLVVEREIFDALVDQSRASVTQQYFYDDRGRLTRVETTDILIDRDVPATIDEFEYECESEEPRFFSGG
jgi:YD repeat-containing protein